MPLYLPSLISALFTLNSNHAPPSHHQPSPGLASTNRSPAPPARGHGRREAEQQAGTRLLTSTLPQDRRENGQGGEKHAAEAAREGMGEATGEKRL
ncbi:hypothetical protein V495_03824 [Pseudogymnoascus sp. VKM F-4514 (FW-929)]|nr:hypothetical protein V490_05671 [Pseudogymnoascus sp. VKM F-3557]KFY43692.1 hypothetical protein V495_03824 [Pseudogymnoascus sp. VKM F-4514 (FW-929)]KFY60355.1 hypothetical protein V497_03712 [Pseudogymnoascus sp. VKM F-4516 (FW-969)]